ncbi:MAG: cytochrome c [Rhodopirellula sp.]|nr:cytochrome c [Rhodopirellula sp.]
MTSPFGQAITRYSVVLFVTAILTMFAGCGGGEKKETVSSSGDKKTTASSGSGSKRSPTAKAETDERPTIGGIPLNVYFDNPLQEASDQRLVGQTSLPSTSPGPMSETVATTTPETAATTEPEAKPAVAAKSDGPEWSELITKDELESEVQSIRNDLNSRLTNFGAYKRATREIPVFSSTLAFLADIARRHKDEIKWKEKAHFIRALAAQMADLSSSKSSGEKKSYDVVNESFLKICEILDSNEPAELPEVEAEADFVDFVAIGFLMKRLERGEEWLKNNTGSEGGFTEKGTLAQREVSVFAAISQSFTSEGFGYAEYKDFVEWADGMRDAARTMSKAVSAKNYSEFDAARSKISQSCTQCHGVYRNG